MTSDGQRRCPVGLDRTSSPPQNNVDSDVGSRVLPRRRWVRVTDDDRGTETESSSSSSSSLVQRRSASGARFRLATYNVLSDDTIRPDDYAYCPAELRYMSSRHERIVAEIRHMQPDVICLQVCLLARSGNGRVLFCNRFLGDRL